MLRSHRFLNAVLIEPRVKLEQLVIVTAADKGYYLPLQMLITSLRLSHQCKRIVVYDLGLTATQGKWCLQHGCEVVKPRLIMPRSVWMWQTWNKPAYIADAMQHYPQQKVLWIDADCIITGPLVPIEQKLDHKLFVCTDTAAAYFCGAEGGRLSVTNDPAVYHAYPTTTRFIPGEQPNAGVLGLDCNRQTDRGVLSKWLWMVQQAKKDRSLRNFSLKQHDGQFGLKWYDQGALQWAMEYTGQTDAVHADNRFNDPISLARIQDAQQFVIQLEALHRETSTRIIHFPSGAKPYKRLPNTLCDNALKFPRHRKDLTLFVLGHKDKHHYASRSPCVKYVYLPDIIKENDLAEARIYLSDILNQCPTEYIGLCTAQWDTKYHNKCLPLNRLHTLKMQLSTVWAGERCMSHWLQQSEAAHKGMSRYITLLAARLSVKSLQRCVPWSNNFIAHRSVVLGVQEWWWRCHAIVHREFGPRPKYGMSGLDKSRVMSYLVERYTMLYFCMRNDLEIKQIPI